MKKRVRTGSILRSLLLIVVLLSFSIALALADEPAGGGRSAALPYYNRANRYLSQGRFDDAKRDLLEAIRLFPDEPDFHTNLGIAYRKLDQYADAEREFKIAIAYNRDDWTNWSDLANAYLKQDMLEKTVATFEETLKHKPPLKEQEAIKQDIADIKKVLAVRQGASLPANSSEPSASATIIKKKGAAKPVRSGMQQKARAGSQGVSNMVKPLAPQSSVSDVLPQPKDHAKQDSKKSDWGYDLK